MEKAEISKILTDIQGMIERAETVLADIAKIRKEAVLDERLRILDLIEAEFPGEVSDDLTTMGAMLTDSVVELAEELGVVKDPAEAETIRAIDHLRLCALGGST